jgi:hypothetical protein
MKVWIWAFLESEREGDEARTSNMNLVQQKGPSPNSYVLSGSSEDILNGVCGCC